MEKNNEKIKNSLNKKASNQYNEMIENTINLIKEGKIEQEKPKVIQFESNKNSKIKKFLQTSVACILIGILGVTTYAGVIRKINIGITGHKKIDENYNDVATEIDKIIDNEYFTLSLNSMAADPAYLIFEYNLNIKDKGLEKINEVPYNEYDGYGISLLTTTTVNDKDISIQYGNNLGIIEKISENEYKIVELYNIANITDTTLKVKKKINNLIISDDLEEGLKLNVDIAQELRANVKFENVEKNILAEKELKNGSTLYIESVANSKFENYVLARVITKLKSVKDLPNRASEFGIEDPQFSICNQNDETINFDYYRLEEFYEKVLENGETIQYESLNYDNFNDTDQIRIQQVQLLRLGFDNSNPPEKIKILPVVRNVYNEHNQSEYEFYKNEDWYQLQLGDNNISEESQIGGKVTITKIEETEDNIIFYYDKEGYVPSDIDSVLRVKNKKMNYIYPRIEKIKGINSEENKMIYAKDSYLSCGMPLIAYERYDNINDLEFAMFYNVKYDILSKALEFDWNPNECENVAKIENIEFSDYTLDINDKLEEAFSSNGANLVLYEGVITKIDKNTLKFFSGENQKELTLSNPNNFEYVNARTNKGIDFSDIKENDILYTDDYGEIKYENFNSSGKKFTKLKIFKNLKGNDLKQELIKNMVSRINKYFDYTYRELKNIEYISKDEAILTLEFSDPYKYITGSEEKFTNKFKIDSNTKIYRNWWDDLASLYTITDLKTVKYVPSRVDITIDEKTINDKIPTVIELNLGYLDE